MNGDTISPAGAISSSDQPVMVLPVLLGKSTAWQSFQNHLHVSIEKQNQLGRPIIVIILVPTTQRERIDTSELQELFSTLADEFNNLFLIIERNFSHLLKPEQYIDFIVTSVDEIRAEMRGEYFEVNFDAFSLVT